MTVHAMTYHWMETYEKLMGNVHLHDCSENMAECSYKSNENLNWQTSRGITESEGLQAICILMRESTSRMTREVFHLHYRTCDPPNLLQS